MWAASIRSDGEIKVGRGDCNKRDFVYTSGQAFYGQCWTGEGKQLTSSIACLYFMSSITEAVISEVFKRPLLWDRRNKEYHNRVLCWHRSAAQKSKDHRTKKNYKRWRRPGVRGWISIFRGSHVWNTGCCSDCALRAPKRKTGKWTLNYQEEMLRLENRKLEWLIK